jgi:hypothetical protein
MQRGTPVVIFTVVVVALLAAYLFQLWIRHQRRLIIHRERLAALEKGVDLPPLVEEMQRGSFNVQRLLLLAGLCWVSVGVALFMTLIGLAGGDLSLPIGFEASGFTWASVHVHSGFYPLGLAPIGIGLSHIIVYLVGRHRD